MPSYVTPKKNTAWIGYIGLVSQANTKVLQANPTLATGDFKISIDGGAFANLATLPTVTPAAGTGVKVSLSAAEMNGDNLTIACIDAAGAEWCDLLINIQTTAGQIDDLPLVDLVTTTTNLTNAPTSGDLTATMKTSVTTAATAATPVATVSGDLSATMKTSVGTAVQTQLGTALSDSVPADGSIPSLNQAAYMIMQFLGERSISGTTMTVRKVDGTTALMTFTLNDATSPTSLTRAT